MRRKSLLLLVSLAVVAIPAVSFAGDRFTDVPDSNIFHDDIGWLADQGVTKGCNPPANSEFCPDDPVTRQQMAAFMRRFSNTLQDGGSSSLLVGSEGPGGVIGESNWATLDSFNVTAPTGGGALLLNGTAAFFLQDISVDLGAVGILEITVDQACSDTSTGVASIWNSFSAGGDTATSVGSLPVSQGSHTVRLCAIAFHLDTTESTDVLVPRVSSLWVADGDVSTLAAADATGIPKALLMERAENSLESLRDD